jgi:hypothetical protein
MAWTTPNTPAVGDVLSASNYATYIRDNLNWLLTGRGLIYSRSTGNYTTTSAVYVDVDGTNFSFTLTNVGTKVFVSFNGFLQPAANGTTANLTVSLDGVDQPDLWFYWTTLNISTNYQVCFSTVLTVTPGSHTIKLRWKTNGTLTLIGGTYLATMAVMEIG